ncbi:hypothetical protein CO154_00365 [Candidatus Pacearchaeota archaeon CG_4_9_14_3_um_filter_31_7]|nr:MAG: hypothetical protein COU55_00455 [Candidatus Pacearchaeota archaeon CG10_big_fil_rev_8_21_14_0_10_31_59]PJA70928.1 MAG: hypothetical protein CO154_00365 [Candidatus Pacearchaeota archaeon CG_4_9_14_3_um_filter_31_7]
MKRKVIALSIVIFMFLILVGIFIAMTLNQDCNDVVGCKEKYLEEKYNYNPVYEEVELVKPEEGCKTCSMTGVLH